LHIAVVTPSIIAYRRNNSSTPDPCQAIKTPLLCIFQPTFQIAYLARILVNMLHPAQLPELYPASSLPSVAHFFSKAIYKATVGHGTRVLGKTMEGFTCEAGSARIGSLRTVAGTDGLGSGVQGESGGRWGDKYSLSDEEMEGMTVSRRG
jgi:hypothetical protein